MGKVLSAFENGFPGAIARSVDDIVIAMANRSASPIEFGMPVALSADRLGIEPFDPENHIAQDFVGVTVRAPAKTPDVYGAETASYAPGDMVDILVRGRIVVQMTEGDPWPGDTLAIVRETGRFGVGVGSETYLYLDHARVTNRMDSNNMVEVILLSREVN